MSVLARTKDLNDDWELAGRAFEVNDSKHEKHAQQLPKVLLNLGFSNKTVSEERNSH